MKFSLLLSTLVNKLAEKIEPRPTTRQTTATRMLWVRLAKACLRPRCICRLPRAADSGSQLRRKVREAIRFRNAATGSRRRSERAASMPGTSAASVSMSTITTAETTSGRGCHGIPVCPARDSAISGTAA